MKSLPFPSISTSKAYCTAIVLSSLCLVSCSDKKPTPQSTQPAPKPPSPQTNSKPQPETTADKSKKLIASLSNSSTLPATKDVINHAELLLQEGSPAYLSAFLEAIVLTLHPFPPNPKNQDPLAAPNQHIELPNISFEQVKRSLQTSSLTKELEKPQFKYIADAIIAKEINAVKNIVFLRKVFGTLQQKPEFVIPLQEIFSEHYSQWELHPEQLNSILSEAIANANPFVLKQIRHITKSNSRSIRSFISYTLFENDSDTQQAGPFYSLLKKDPVVAAELHASLIKANLVSSGDFHLKAILNALAEVSTAPSDCIVYFSTVAQQASICNKLFKNQYYKDVLTKVYHDDFLQNRQKDPPSTDEEWQKLYTTTFTNWLNAVPKQHQYALYDSLYSILRKLSLEYIKDDKVFIKHSKFRVKAAAAFPMLEIVALRQTLGILSGKESQWAKDMLSPERFNAAIDAHDDLNVKIWYVGSYHYPIKDTTTIPALAKFAFETKLPGEHYPFKNVYHYEGSANTLTDNTRTINKSISDSMMHRINQWNQQANSSSQFKNLVNDTVRSATTGNRIDIILELYKRYENLINTPRSELFTLALTSDHPDLLTIVFKHPEQLEQNSSALYHAFRRVGKSNFEKFSSYEKYGTTPAHKFKIALYMLACRDALDEEAPEQTRLVRMQKLADRFLKVEFPSEQDRLESLAKLAQEPVIAYQVREQLAAFAKDLTPAQVIGRPRHYVDKKNNLKIEFTRKLYIAHIGCKIRDGDIDYVDAQIRGCYALDYQDAYKFEEKLYYTIYDHLLELNLQGKKEILKRMIPTTKFLLATSLKYTQFMEKLLVRYTQSLCDLTHASDHKIGELIKWVYTLPKEQQQLYAEHRKYIKGSDWSSPTIFAGCYMLHLRGKWDGPEAEDVRVALIHTLMGDPYVHQHISPKTFKLDDGRVIQTESMQIYGHRKSDMEQALKRWQKNNPGKPYLPKLKIK